MKKITFLLIAILATSFSSAQDNGSGQITLTTGYSVQFDINTVTDVVTLTMIGPSDRWLGVALGNASYTPGSGMAQFNGSDCITYVNGVLNDRAIGNFSGQPPLDSTQNWSVVSDDVNGSVRTVVGTRARDTGDSADFVFPTTTMNGQTIVWAMGNPGTVGAINYHSSNRSATVVNFTLGVDDFSKEPSFTISPNPARERMNIELNPRIQNAKLQIYDVLGKRIIDKEISDINASLNVSNWNNGIYIVRLTSGDLSETKRFVKQ